MRFVGGRGGQGGPGGGGGGFERGGSEDFGGAPVGADPGGMDDFGGAPDDDIPFENRPRGANRVANSRHRNGRRRPDRGRQASTGGPEPSSASRGPINLVKKHREAPSPDGRMAFAA